ncbi:MAG: hypothetical protein L0Z49_05810 [Actinobacteria bacterium]|nr:hypothetical protein [Actinomycetota bacterium]
MEATLGCDGWSRRVTVARGFWQRLRGIRGRSGADSILIATRSVHGFGVGRPILAVGLDSGLRVVVIRDLPPGRIVWSRGVRWWLELPADAEPPAVGRVLEVTLG